MLRSMTGFGRSAGTLGRHAVEVEVKSVNHRHCEVKLSAPRNLAALELSLVSAVKQRIDRGRLDVYLRMTRSPEAAPGVQVDLGLAGAILAEACRLAENLDLPEDFSLSSLLQFPGVLNFEEEESDLEALGAGLLPILDEALSQLLESKTREGAALRQELEGRLARLSQLADVIESHRPRVLQEYREKLAERIRLLTENSEPDENRIATETAYFAERCDITEEMVRFRAHLARFAEILSSNHNRKRYESVGRSLDFIVQELLREANTLVNKSSSMEIIAPALEIKSEVEKIREQVQNVE